MQGGPCQIIGGDRGQLLTIVSLQCEAQKSITGSTSDNRPPVTGIYSRRIQLSIAYCAVWTVWCVSWWRMYWELFAEIIYCIYHYHNHYAWYIINLRFDKVMSYINERFNAGLAGMQRSMPIKERGPKPPHYGVVYRCHPFKISGWHSKHETPPGFVWTPAFESLDFVLSLCLWRILFFLPRKRRHVVKRC